MCRTDSQQKQVAAIPLNSRSYTNFHQLPVGTTGKHSRVHPHSCRDEKASGQRALHAVAGAALAEHMRKHCTHDNSWQAYGELWERKNFKKALKVLSCLMNTDEARYSNEGRKVLSLMQLGLR